MPEDPLRPAQPAQAAGFAWRLDPSADVGRAILAASRRLREAEVESPQLDSALLMAHVLDTNKTWLYAHPDRKLTADEIARFETLVGRRLRHEPIAYLIGYRSFYGLDIIVDPRVLIPRPETEMLVERALAWINRLATDGVRPVVADVGTGSGAIAVAIAANAPAARIYAADISPGALEVAAQNVARHGLGERVTLLQGNLLEPLPEPADVIVANLPYVASGDLPTLAPQVRDFEPALALDGGPDGLRLLAMLLASGRAKLRPDARLYLEIGADEGKGAHWLASDAFPGAQVEVQADYAGLDRLLVVMT